MSGQGSSARDTDGEQAQNQAHKHDQAGNVSEVVEVSERGETERRARQEAAEEEEEEEEERARGAGSCRKADRERQAGQAGSPSTRGDGQDGGSSAEGGGIVSLILSLLGKLSPFIFMYLSVVGLVIVAQRQLLFVGQSSAGSHGLGDSSTPDPLERTPYADARLIRGGLAGPDAPGPAVAALYIPPETPGSPIIVFWHGNADQLAYGPVGVGNELRKRYGYGFYGIEYPGYGVAAAPGRPGPSEESIYNSSEAALIRLSAPTTRGKGAAVAGLGVPRESIVLFGQSIGCAVAVEMAARGYGSGMILLSPFSSIAHMAEAMFPAWLIRPWTSAGFVSDPFDNLGKALASAVPSAVAKRTCVVHGDQDEVVPYSQGRAVAAALKGSKFHTLKKAGHNDVWGRRFAELLFHKVKRCIETATRKPKQQRSNNNNKKKKAGSPSGTKVPAADDFEAQDEEEEALSMDAPPVAAPTAGGSEEDMDIEGLSVDDDEDDSI